MSKKIKIILLIIIILCSILFTIIFTSGLNDWYSTDIELKKVINEFGTTEYGVEVSQKEGIFENKVYVISQLTYNGDNPQESYVDSIGETKDSFRYRFTFDEKNNYMTYYVIEEGVITIDDDLNTCDKELKYQDSWINTIEKSDCFSSEQIKHFEEYFEFYEQNVKTLSPENVSLVRG